MLYEKKAFDFQHIGQVYNHIVVKKERFQYIMFKLYSCRPSLSEPIGSHECIPPLQSLLASAWDTDPSKRPSFNQIIEKLNEIILEYEIPDPKGRIFWVKSFRKKVEKLALPIQ